MAIIEEIEFTAKGLDTINSELQTTQENMTKIKTEAQTGYENIDQLIERTTDAVISQTRATQKMIRVMQEGKKEDNAVYNESWKQKEEDAKSAVRHSRAMRDLVSENGDFDISKTMTNFNSYNEEIKKGFNQIIPNVVSLIMEGMRTSMQGSKSKVIPRASDLFDDMIRQNKFDQILGQNSINAPKGSQFRQQLISMTKAFIPYMMGTINTEEYAKKIYGQNYTGAVSSTTDLGSLIPKSLLASYRESISKGKGTYVASDAYAKARERGMTHISQKAIMDYLIPRFETNEQAVSAGLKSNLLVRDMTGHLKLGSTSIDTLRKYEEELFKIMEIKTNGGVNKINMFDIADENAQKSASRLMGGGAAGRALVALQDVSNLLEKKDTFASLPEVIGLLDKGVLPSASSSVLTSNDIRIKEGRRVPMEHYVVTKLSMASQKGGSKFGTINQINPYQIAIDESNATRLIGLGGHDNEYTDAVISMAIDEENEDLRRAMIKQYKENGLMHNGIEYVLQGMHGLGKDAEYRFVKKSVVDQINNSKEVQDFIKKWQLDPSSSIFSGFINPLKLKSAHDYGRYWDQTNKIWSGSYDTGIGREGGFMHGKNLAIVDFEAFNRMNGKAKGEGLENVNGIAWLFGNSDLIQGRGGTSMKGMFSSVGGKYVKDNGEFDLLQYAIDMGIYDTQSKKAMLPGVNGVMFDLLKKDSSGQYMYGGMASTDLVKNLMALDPNNPLHQGENANMLFSEMMRWYPIAQMYNAATADSSSDNLGTQAARFMSMPKEFRDKVTQAYKERLTALDTVTGIKNLVLNDPDDPLRKQLDEAEKQSGEQGGSYFIQSNEVQSRVRKYKEKLYKQMMGGVIIDDDNNIQNKVLASNNVAAYMAAGYDISNEDYEKIYKQIEDDANNYKNAKGEKSDEKSKLLQHYTSLFGGKRGFVRQLFTLEQQTKRTDKNGNEYDVYYVNDFGTDETSGTAIRFPFALGNGTVTENLAQFSKIAYDYYSQNRDPNSIMLPARAHRYQSSSDLDGDKIKVLYGDVARMTAETIAQWNAYRKEFGIDEDSVAIRKTEMPQEEFDKKSDTDRFTQLTEMTIAAAPHMGTGSAIGMRGTMLKMNREIFKASLQGNQAYDIWSTPKNFDEIKTQDIPQSFWDILSRGREFTHYATSLDKIFNVPKREKDMTDDQYLDLLKQKGVEIDKIDDLLEIDGYSINKKALIESQLDRTNLPSAFNSADILAVSTISQLARMHPELVRQADIVRQAQDTLIGTPEWAQKGSFAERYINMRRDAFRDYNAGIRTTVDDLTPALRQAEYLGKSEIHDYFWNAFNRSKNNGWSKEGLTDLQQQFVFGLDTMAKRQNFIRNEQAKYGFGIMAINPEEFGITDKNMSPEEYAELARRNMAKAQREIDASEINAGTSQEYKEAVDKISENAKQRKTRTQNERLARQSAKAAAAKQNEPYPPVEDVSQEEYQQVINAIRSQRKKEIRRPLESGLEGSVRDLPPFGYTSLGAWMTGLDNGGFDLNSVQVYDLKGKNITKTKNVQKEIRDILKDGKYFFDTSDSAKTLQAEEDMRGFIDDKDTVIGHAMHDAFKTAFRSPTPFTGEELRNSFINSLLTEGGKYNQQLGDLGYKITQNGTNGQYQLIASDTGKIDAEATKKINAMVGGTTKTGKHSPGTLEQYYDLLRRDGALLMTEGLLTDKSNADDIKEGFGIQRGVTAQDLTNRRSSFSPDSMWVIGDDANNFKMVDYKSSFKGALSSIVQMGAYSHWLEEKALEEWRADPENKTQGKYKRFINYSKDKDTGEETYTSNIKKLEGFDPKNGRRVLFDYTKDFGAYVASSVDDAIVHKNEDVLSLSPNSPYVQAEESIYRSIAKKLINTKEYGPMLQKLGIDNVVSEMMPDGFDLYNEEVNKRVDAIKKERGIKNIEELINDPIFRMTSTEPWLTGSDEDKRFHIADRTRIVDQNGNEATLTEEQKDLSLNPSYYTGQKYRKEKAEAELKGQNETWEMLSGSLMHEVFNEAHAKNLKVEDIPALFAAKALSREEGTIGGKLFQAGYDISMNDNGEFVVNGKEELAKRQGLAEKLNNLYGVHNGTETKKGMIEQYLEEMRAQGTIVQSEGIEIGKDSNVNDIVQGDGAHHGTGIAYYGKIGQQGQYFPKTAEERTAKGVYMTTFAPDAILDMNNAGSFKMIDYKSSLGGASQAIAQMAIYAHQIEEKAVQAWETGDKNLEAYKKYIDYDSDKKTYTSKISELEALDARENLRIRTKYDREFGNEVAARYEAAKQAKYADMTSKNGIYAGISEAQDLEIRKSVINEMRNDKRWGQYIQNMEAEMAQQGAAGGIRFAVTQDGQMVPVTNGMAGAMAAGPVMITNGTDGKAIVANVDSNAIANAVFSAEDTKAIVDSQNEAYKKLLQYSRPDKGVSGLSRNLWGIVAAQKQEREEYEKLEASDFANMREDAILDRKNVHIAAPEAYRNALLSLVTDDKMESMRLLDNRMMNPKSMSPEQLEKNRNLIQATINGYDQMLGLLGDDKLLADVPEGEQRDRIQKNLDKATQFITDQKKILGDTSSLAAQEEKALGAYVTGNESRSYSMIGYGQYGGITGNVHANAVNKRAKIESDINAYGLQISELDRQLLEKENGEFKYTGKEKEIRETARDRLKEIQANEQAYLDSGRIERDEERMAAFAQQNYENEITMHNMNMKRNRYGNMSYGFGSRVVNMQRQVMSSYKGDIQRTEGLITKAQSEYEKYYNEKGELLPGADPKEANKASENLNKLKGDLKDLQSGYEQAASKGELFTSGLNVLGSSLNNLTMQFGRRMFRSALNEAKQFVKQFDQQMTQIQMITMKTDEEMVSVRKNTINTALELKTSVANVASTEAALYRQGLGDEEMQNRLESVVKFAQVAGIKTEEATKIITTALNNNLVGSAEEAVDALTALGDGAATTAAEISKALQKSAATANITGVSYEELVSMITLVESKTQLSGSQVGTAFNTIFSRMKSMSVKQYVEDESGEVTNATDVGKALALAGVSMEDEGGNFKNTTDILLDLSKVWNNLNEKVQSVITKSIAGTRMTNIFSTLMSGLAEDNGALFQQYLDMAENSAGITSEKYETYAESLAASMTTMKTAFDGFVETIGASGAGKAVFGAITGFFENLTSLSENSSGIATGIIAIFTALAAGTAMVLAAMGPLSSIAGIIGILGGLVGLVVTKGIANLITPKNTEEKTAEELATKRHQMLRETGITASKTTLEVAVKAEGAVEDLKNLKSKIEEIEKTGRQLVTDKNQIDFEELLKTPELSGFKKDLEDLIEIFPELGLSLLKNAGNWKDFEGQIQTIEARVKELKQDAVDVGTKAVMQTFDDTYEKAHNAYIEQTNTISAAEQFATMEAYSNGIPKLFDYIMDPNYIQGSFNLPNLVNLPELIPFNNADLHGVTYSEYLNSMFPMNSFEHARTQEIIPYFYLANKYSKVFGETATFKDIYASARLKSDRQGRYFEENGEKIYLTNPDQIYLQDIIDTGWGSDNAYRNAQFYNNPTDRLVQTVYLMLEKNASIARYKSTDNSMKGMKLLAAALNNEYGFSDRAIGQTLQKDMKAYFSAGGAAEYASLLFEAKQDINTWDQGNNAASTFFDSVTTFKDLMNYVETLDSYGLQNFTSGNNTYSKQRNFVDKVVAAYITNRLPYLVATPDMSISTKKDEAITSFLSSMVSKEDLSYLTSSSELQEFIVDEFVTRMRTKLADTAGGEDKLFNYLATPAAKVAVMNAKTDLLTELNQRYIEYGTIGGWTGAGQYFAIDEKGQKYYFETLDERNKFAQRHGYATGERVSGSGTSGGASSGSAGTTGSGEVLDNSVAAFHRTNVLNDKAAQIAKTRVEFTRMLASTQNEQDILDLVTEGYNQLATNDPLLNVMGNLLNAGSIKAEEFKQFSQSYKTGSIANNLGGWLRNRADNNANEMASQEWINLIELADKYYGGSIMTDYISARQGKLKPDQAAAAELAFQRAYASKYISENLPAASLNDEIARTVADNLFNEAMTPGETKYINAIRNIISGDEGLVWNAITTLTGKETWTSDQFDTIIEQIYKGFGTYSSAMLSAGLERPSWHGETALTAFDDYVAKQGKTNKDMINSVKEAIDEYKEGDLLEYLSDTVGEKYQGEWASFFNGKQGIATAAKLYRNKSDVISGFTANDLIDVISAEYYRNGAATFNMGLRWLKLLGVENGQFTTENLVAAQAKYANLQEDEQALANAALQAILGGSIDYLVAPTDKTGASASLLNRAVQKSRLEDITKYWTDEQLKNSTISMLDKITGSEGYAAQFEMVSELNRINDLTYAWNKQNTYGIDRLTTEEAEMLDKYGMYAGNKAFDQILAGNDLERMQSSFIKQINAINTSIYGKSGISETVQLFGNTIASALNYIQDSSTGEYSIAGFNTDFGRSLSTDKELWQIATEYAQSRNGKFIGNEGVVALYNEYAGFMKRKNKEQKWSEWSGFSSETAKFLSEHPEYIGLLNMAENENISESDILRMIMLQGIESPMYNMDDYRLMMKLYNGGNMLFTQLPEWAPTDQLPPVMQNMYDELFGDMARSSTGGNADKASALYGANTKLLEMQMKEKFGTNKIATNFISDMLQEDEQGRVFTNLLQQLDTVNRAFNAYSAWEFRDADRATKDEINVPEFGDNEIADIAKALGMNEEDVLEKLPTGEIGARLNDLRQGVNVGMFGYLSSVASLMGKSLYNLEYSDLAGESFEKAFGYTLDSSLLEKLKFYTNKAANTNGRINTNSIYMAGLGGFTYDDSASRAIDLASAWRSMTTEEQNREFIKATRKAFTEASAGGRMNYEDFAAVALRNMNYGELGQYASADDYKEWLENQELISRIVEGGLLGPGSSYSIDTAIRDIEIANGSTMRPEDIERFYSQTISQGKSFNAMRRRYESFSDKYGDAFAETVYSSLYGNDVYARLKNNDAAYYENDNSFRMATQAGIEAARAGAKEYVDQNRSTSVDAYLDYLRNPTDENLFESEYERLNRAQWLLNKDTSRTTEETQELEGLYGRYGYENRETWLKRLQEQIPKDVSNFRTDIDRMIFEATGIDTSGMAQGSLSSIISMAYGRDNKLSEFLRTYDLSSIGQYDFSTDEIGALEAMHQNIVDADAVRDQREVFKLFSSILRNNENVSLVKTAKMLGKETPDVYDRVFGSGYGLLLSRMIETPIGKPLSNEKYAKLVDEMASGQFTTEGGFSTLAEYLIGEPFNGSIEQFEKIKTNIGTMFTDTDSYNTAIEIMSQAIDGFGAFMNNTASAIDMVSSYQQKMLNERLLATYADSPKTMKGISAYISNFTGEIKSFFGVITNLRDASAQSYVELYNAYYDASIEEADVSKEDLEKYNDLFDKYVSRNMGYIAWIVEQATGEEFSTESLKKYLSSTGMVEDPDEFVSRYFDEQTGTVKITDWSKRYSNMYSSQVAEEVNAASYRNLRTEYLKWSQNPTFESWMAYANEQLKLGAYGGESENDAKNNAAIWNALAKGYINGEDTANILNDVQNGSGPVRNLKSYLTNRFGRNFMSEFMMTGTRGEMDITETDKAFIEQISGIYGDAGNYLKLMVNAGNDDAFRDYREQFRQAYAMQSLEDLHLPEEKREPAVRYLEEMLSEALGETGYFTSMANVASYRYMLNTGEDLGVLSNRTEYSDMVEGLAKALGYQGSENKTAVQQMLEDYYASGETEFDRRTWGLERLDRIRNNEDFALNAALAAAGVDVSEWEYMDENKRKELMTGAGFSPFEAETMARSMTYESGFLIPDEAKVYGAALKDKQRDLYNAGYGAYRSEQHKAEISQAVYQAINGAEDFYQVMANIDRIYGTDKAGMAEKYLQENPEALSILSRIGKSSGQTTYDYNQARRDMWRQMSGTADVTREDVEYMNKAVFGTDEYGNIRAIDINNANYAKLLSLSYDKNFTTLFDNQYGAGSFARLLDYSRKTTGNEYVGNEYNDLMQGMQYGEQMAAARTRAKSMFGGNEELLNTMNGMIDELFTGQGMTNTYDIISKLTGNAKTIYQTQRALQRAEGGDLSTNVVETLMAATGIKDKDTFMQQWKSDNGKEFIRKQIGDYVGNLQDMLSGIVAAVLDMDIENVRGMDTSSVVAALSEKGGEAFQWLIDLINSINFGKDMDGKDFAEQSVADALAEKAGNFKEAELSGRAKEAALEAFRTSDGTPEGVQQRIIELTSKQTAEEAATEKALGMTIDQYVASKMIEKYGEAYESSFEVNDEMEADRELYRQEAENKIQAEQAALGDLGKYSDVDGTVIAQAVSDTAAGILLDLAGKTYGASEAGVGGHTWTKDEAYALALGNFTGTNPDVLQSQAIFESFGLTSGGELNAENFDTVMANVGAALMGSDAMLETLFRLMDSDVQSWLSNIYKEFGNMADGATKASTAMDRFGETMIGKRAADFLQFAQYGSETVDIINGIAKGGSYASDTMKDLSKQVSKLSKGTYSYNKALDKNAELTKEEATALAEAAEYEVNELFDAVAGKDNAYKLKEGMLDNIESSLTGQKDKVIGIFKNLWSFIQSEAQTEGVDLSKFVNIEDGSFDFSQAKAAVSAGLASLIALIESYQGTLHMEFGDAANLITIIWDALGSNPNSGGGGGGGGGKGKSAADKLVEKLKHIKEQFEHAMNLLNYEASFYENNGQLLKQNKIYEQQLALMGERKAELLNEIATLNDEIKKVKPESDDYYTLVSALYEVEEEYQKLVVDADELNKKMEENIRQANKYRVDVENLLYDAIEKEMQVERDKLDAKVEFEEQVLDIIKQRYQDEWDLIKEDIEKKKQALEDEKTLIEERLQARKEAEDDAQKYEQIAELRRQLAAIETDSTRTKDAAAMRKQLEDLERQVGYDISEDEAQTQTGMIDDQIEAYDEYMTMGDDYIEALLDDATNFSSQVSEILRLSQTEFLEWLKANDQAYLKASQYAQQQMIESWNDTWRKLKGDIKPYWDQVEAILEDETGDTFFKFLESTTEFMTSTAAGQTELIAQWTEAWEAFVQSTKMDGDYEYFSEGVGIVTDYGGGTHSGVRADGDKYEKPDTMLGSGEGSQLQGSGKSTPSGSGTPSSQGGPLHDLGEFFSPVVGFVETILHPKDLTPDEVAYAQSFEVQDEKTLWDTIVDGVHSLFGFSSGGMANFTGLALLHGSSKEPERILSPHQTELFEDMVNSLEDMDKEATAETQLTPKQYAQQKLMEKWQDSWKQAFEAAKADETKSSYMDRFESYFDTMIQMGYVQVPNIFHDVSEATQNGQSGFNVENVNITLNEAQLNDDADYEQVAEKVGDLFVKELGKRGMNTLSYSF